MGYGGWGADQYIFNAQGAIGGVPARQSTECESVGNILCFPFSADTLDKSGNHTIDDGNPKLVTQLPAANPNDHYTYDGNNMLEADQVATEAPRIIASTQAHQIPLTEPVTFGMFMYARTWGGGTPQLMVSGPGSNASNYGMQRQGSVGWRYQGDAGNTTTLGDQRDLTPTGRWFHWTLAIAGSRNTASAAKFYINGTPVWSGNVTSGDPPLSTDNFSFISDSDESTGGWNGFVCNCFVTDTLLSDATIKALSDESFGHASPFAPHF